MISQLNLITNFTSFTYSSLFFTDLSVLQKSIHSTAHKLDQSACFTELTALRVDELIPSKASIYL